MRAVVALFLVTAGTAHAQQVDELTRSNDDDNVDDNDELIYVPGLRPIEQRRVAALVSTGTQGTQRAAVHALERHGRHAFELDGAIRDREIDGDRVQQATDANYGARWMFLRSDSRIDARAFGSIERFREEGGTSGSVTVPTATQGARAELSRRFTTGRFGHELSIGGGLVLASGSTNEELPRDVLAQMSSVERRVKGEHRFLDAYLEDTIRVIDSLDVSGGFVIEDWSFLNGHHSIVYGVGQEMATDTPEESELFMSPELGVLHRVNDQLAVRVRGSRSLGVPALGDLYRPQLGIAPNAGLHPEHVWAVEAGPEITVGPLAATARAFVRAIDSPITNVTQADGSLARGNLGGARATGVDTQASWRPAKAWLATVGYTFASTLVTDAETPNLVGKRLAQAPRQRAEALVTFDEPTLVKVTGAVRYVDRSWQDDRNTRSSGAYTLVDAMAMRKVTGHLAGFLAVENLLDRKYLPDRTAFDTLGAPRTFHVGVRIDTSEF